tara:strand:- start:1939 stop:2238 length:300 start_codon:yes stop_codon:yes gene_type:complete
MDDVLASLANADEDRKRAVRLLKTLSKKADVSELQELILPYFTRVEQMVSNVDEFKMNVVSMLEQQDKTKKAYPTKRCKPSGDSSWHVNPFVIYSAANK